MALRLQPPSAALTQPTAPAAVWARICTDVARCHPHFAPLSTQEAAQHGAWQASDLVRWAWQRRFDVERRCLRLGVAVADVCQAAWLAQVEGSLRRVCGPTWQLQADVVPPALSTAHLPAWAQVQAWWRRTARTDFGRLVVSQLTCPEWDAARRTCLLQAPAVTDQELQDTLACSLRLELAALRGETWAVQVQPAPPGVPVGAAARRSLRVYARREGVAARTMDRCLARDVGAVQRQLRLWPLRRARYPDPIRHPAGLLTAALQADWGLPDRAAPPR